MSKQPVPLEPDRRWQYLAGTLSDLERISSEWPVGVAVPEPIAKMFATARDLFIHGYFKYEFLFVSIVWGLLIVEAALRDLLKAPDNVRLKRLIRQAHQKGWISDPQVEVLEAGRELRNMWAHPRQQGVITPATAAEQLHTTHLLVSELYEARTRSPSLE